MTNTPPPSAATPATTIDITDAANKAASTFATYGIELLFTMATKVPGLQWLALPLISTVFRAGLSWVVNTLVNDAMLQLFFLNTALRKASQASDFVNAVNAKLNLPPNATRDQIKAAEANQMAAFKQFAMVTN